jgi:hypothetical protein
VGGVYGERKIVNEISYRMAIICPSCLHENKDKEKYCEKCNIPIGITATIDPVQSAVYEGRGISDGIMKPKKKIIVFGMWLLFIPYVILYIYFGILLIFQSGEFNLIGFLISLVFGLLALFFGFLVVKTTRNYLKLRNESKRKDFQNNREKE